MTPLKSTKMLYMSSSTVSDRLGTTSSASCLRNQRFSKQLLLVTPYREFSFYLLFTQTDGHMGPALLAAYRDYLERMFDDTDDLVVVDMFTVPTDVNETLLSEWADVE